MKSWRILVVNDHASRGGAEEVYQTTVRALAEIDGVDVSTFDGSMLEVEEKASTRFWNRHAAQRLDEKLKAFKPDLIWLHNFHNFLSPAILLPLRRYKRQSGASVVQTAHDYLPAFFTPDMMYFDGDRPRPVPRSDVGSLRAFLTPSSSKGRVHDLIKKVHWLAIHATLAPHHVIDLYLCPSRFLLETLQQSGIDKSMLFLNPSADVPFVPQRTRSSDASGLRLAFAGRLSYEKGIDEFLLLARQIDFAHIDSITLYGDGPMANRLRQDFAALIDSGKLIMAGRVPHEKLPGLLRQHDAMVLPSVWYENAPMVIPEAAASGLPILVRDLGSMTTYGEEIGNKVLFSSSPEGLRRALAELNDKLGMTPAPIFDLSEMTRQRYHENIHRLLERPAFTAKSAV